MRPRSVLLLASALFAALPVLVCLVAGILLTPSVAAAQAIVNEDAKLTASDAAAGDIFGLSVAVSGDTVVVGAEGDSEVADQAGAAYVYVGTGSVWSEQEKLTASDGEAIDHFGEAVAISGDTLVVGAVHSDDVFRTSGSAYVFVRAGTTWSEQAKLTASDPIQGHLFGSPVAISGDTILIGASNDGDGGKWAGAAYVFVRNGTTWSEQAKLTASDPAEEAFFGVAGGIFGDTAVVGSIDHDAGPESGSAYVFVRSGTVWSEQAKLTASDAKEDDRFGEAVAIWGDTIVVGARGVDRFIGAAYVFVRAGIAWSEQAKLTTSDTGVVANFGDSVDVSNDTAVVGARSSADGGSTYVFGRSGTAWIEEVKLKASDAASGDAFGDSVAVFGATAVVGASGDDDEGSAYVFVFPSSTVSLDIKPGSETNPINLFSKGIIPVAILGSDSFDIAEVDAMTLAFGPDGAAPAHAHGPHLDDVNDDDFMDLVAHFRTQETGIAFDAVEACLTGETLDGTPFEGCDDISAIPLCGIGFELALLVPPLMWLHRRRRRVPR